MNKTSCMDVALEKNYQESKYDRTKAKSVLKIAMEVIKFSMGESGIVDIGTRQQHVNHGFRMEHLERLDETQRIHLQRIGKYKYCITLTAEECINNMPEDLFQADLAYSQKHGL